MLTLAPRRCALFAIERGGGLDAEDDDAFDVAVEDAISDKPTRGGSGPSKRGRGNARMPRSARDSKFGFGSGKGRRDKQNTRESANDIDAIAGGGRGGRSGRGRGGFGGGGKRGGRGGGGAAKRCVKYWSFRVFGELTQTCLLLASTGQEKRADKQGATEHYFYVMFMYSRFLALLFSFSSSKSVHFDLWVCFERICLVILLC